MGTKINGIRDFLAISQNESAEIKILINNGVNAYSGARCSYEKSQKYYLHRSWMKGISIENEKGCGFTLNAELVSSLFEVRGNLINIYSPSKRPMTKDEIGWRDRADAMFMSYTGNKYYEFKKMCMEGPHGYLVTSKPINGLCSRENYVFDYNTKSKLMLQLLLVTCNQKESANG